MVEWDWLPLNVPDKAFHTTISEFDPETIPLTDLGFRDAKGLPATLKLCATGTWNERMIVETTFSMLTLVCHTKKLFHRVAAYIWRFRNMARGRPKGRPYE